MTPPRSGARSIGMRYPFNILWDGAIRALRRPPRSTAPEKAQSSLLENHQGEPDYEPEARTTNRSRVAFAAKTSSNSFSSTTPPPRTVSDIIAQVSATPVSRSTLPLQSPSKASRSTRRPRFRPPYGRARASFRVHTVARGHDADPTTDTIA